MYFIFNLANKKNKIDYSKMNKGMIDIYLYFSNLMKKLSYRILIKYAQFY